ncbi:MAG: tryptophan--tRNA ligase [Candidatus Methylomirabilia bacterium]
MRERVLSGMRPSGKLHLGHLHGALANWRELQERYDSYFFVADWHALTSEYANPAAIRENGRQMVLDWLAAGIDPAKAVIFVQSQVVEHAELHLLLSMITPLSWLERCPTYKEQLEQVKDKDLHTYGFLGYPVLQTADIVMYLANWVPVGVDQLPHLELAREIVRRFHFLYGEGVLVEPQPKLTEFPKIPGTDGRKMSKSYGNSIFLSDTAEETGGKILPMVTDPARVRRTDPGDPAICPVFTLHRVSTPESERDRLAAGCRSAGIGCIDCKRTLIETLNASLAPLRRRRDELAADAGLVERILAAGTARARTEAASVMAAVRRAVRL